MLNQTMKKKTPTLPRRTTPRPVHGFMLYIPIPLWTRMIRAGIKWGMATQFIIQAITEKLDRDNPESPVCSRCNGTKESHEGNKRGHEYTPKK